MRNRNITFESLTADLEKQKKKEKAMSWRDRYNVNLGEGDR